MSVYSQNGHESIRCRDTGGVHENAGGVHEMTLKSYEDSRLYENGIKKRLWARPILRRWTLELIPF